MHRTVARRRTDAGFTLIELLIVIVIIGILAAIVVLSVSQFTDRGKSAACKANLNTATTAVQAYYAKNAAFPASLAALVPSYLTTNPDVATQGAETGVGYNAGTGVTTGGSAC